MFGVRRSQLKASVFVEQPLGLFTVQSIAKNSRLSLSSDLVVRMNDADMDLTSLIGVLDPLELERRLDACLSQYSELDQNNVSSDLIARRDIAPDEELFRKYGWGVWLREMAEMDGLLNERNFAGFAYHVVRHIDVADLAWANRVVPKMSQWMDSLKRGRGSKNVQLLTCGEEIELCVGLSAKRD